MLCLQCRRLATAAVRHKNAISPASQLLGSPSVTRTRGLPFVTVSYTAQYMSSRSYSASSDTAAASAVASQSSPTPEKPDYLDDAESAIWDTLVAEFAPTELTVQDISGGCGSMYGIEIASEKFRGVNMLKQQRMVNAVLGDRMKDWHGVQLRTRLP
ncbi:bola-like protein [Biscogniauxia marginata]|nr:bola-like protein [Biscogniauxia marginata]